MIPDWVTAIIATSAFLVQIGILIWTGSRALSRMEVAIRTDLNIQKDGIILYVNNYKREMDAQRDVDLRMMGETVSALRNKISEVELYIRDNFARRESVHTLGGRLETQIGVLDEKLEDQIGEVYNKIEQRFDKLDEKLDEKIDGIKEAIK